jgi:hypothetical protein
VNPMNTLDTGVWGLLFVVVFFVLMVVLTIRSRGQSRRTLREIAAFTRLRRGVGLAVESGQRLHLSLGNGGIFGQGGSATLVSLTLLQRLARAASISDRPPVASSGEATASLLAQDTLRSAYRAAGADGQYNPSASELTGLTPFSFAAGALPVIYDQQVSANILIGSFGSEAALIADAAERTGSLSLGGSDNPTGQAILYATVQESLVGEELYAAGAYLQAGPAHQASVQVQDILRWILIGLMLAAVVLNLAGVL